MLTPRCNSTVIEDCPKSSLQTLKTLERKKQISALVIVMHRSIFPFCEYVFLNTIKTIRKQLIFEELFGPVATIYNALLIHHQFPKNFHSGPWP